LKAQEVVMGNPMPLGTLLGFGLPPICFIIAIILHYVFTSEEE
jgi:hypothetical protein